MTKSLEPSLLLSQISRWRSRHLRFQDRMHPFVLPILLWFARLNQFGSDAEPDPPESAESRASAFDANGLPLSDRIAFSNPYFLKSRRKVVRVSSISVESSAWATKEVARISIGNGQRIAIAAVTGFELSFEINTPEIIRSGGDGGRLAEMTRFAPLRVLADEPRATQNLTDRPA